MTEFRITATRPDRTDFVLRYDNASSVLTWEASGQPVVPHSEQRDWGTAVVVSQTLPGRKVSPRTLKISLGLSCNFACSYCSQRFVPHVVDASQRDVQPFLDALPSWFDASGDDGQGGGLSVEFWGGEPLVYWKTLKPLAEALRPMLPNAAFSVITNGSLLTLEINAWLDQMGFAVSVSHDGPGQAQRGPDPLADPVQRGAILDLYARLRPQGRISINPVLTRHNHSRGEIASYLKAIFGDDVPLGEGAFVDPYDQGGMAAMPVAGERLAIRRQAYQELKSGMAANFGISHDKIMRFIQSVTYRQLAASLGQKCGMDQPDQMAVTLKGEVLTCQNVSPVSKAQNNAPHKLGHVSDLSGVALRTATHWSQRSDCAACPVLHLCRGACMFLQGKLWEAACDTSFNDNIPFFAAAIEILTGGVPIRIETLNSTTPPRLDRVELW